MGSVLLEGTGSHSHGSGRAQGLQPQAGAQQGDGVVPVQRHVPGKDPSSRLSPKEEKGHECPSLKIIRQQKALISMPSTAGACRHRA